MALEQKLSLRLSQRLVMTPALQQAIKLLQMSTLELREEIATELQENPALEEAPDSEPTDGQEAADAAEGAGEENEGPDALSEVDLDYMLQNYYDGGPTTPRGMRETAEQTGWETNLSRPEDLTSFLTRQFELSTSDDVLQEIGRAIIGNLDASGFLQASLEELVSMGDFRTERVHEALELVQSLEPAGVGARDLQECLLIQLRIRGEGDGPASVVVRDHLELLKARRFEDIAHKMELDRDGLKKVLETLRRLDPCPGDRFGPPAASTVTPDVFVVKMGDVYQILLNDDGFPKLRVSRYCRKILSAGTDVASREDKDFVRQKLNAAIRLIKSIEERQRTIYKVACSIVEQQRLFLEKGINHIRPMVLRDVAEDVGVHESTVSRVVNNKYMHTPNGVFEMRFFFHSGLTNSLGEDVSSLTIKEKIRRMIEAEDNRRPLSDAAIAKRLKAEEEIPIARRTVAKYREELKIPASTLRKRSLYAG